MRTKDQGVRHILAQLGALLLSEGDSMCQRQLDISSVPVDLVYADTHIHFLLFVIYDYDNDILLHHGANLILCYIF